MKSGPSHAKEIAPGCDAGAVLLDGGTPCGPFEGSYAGTYSFRPTAVSACTGSATYSISEAMFSVSGGTLNVRLDRFTLTQSPAPTDGTFDVSFSDGCGSFRLVGLRGSLARDVDRVVRRRVWALLGTDVVGARIAEVSR